MNEKTRRIIAAVGAGAVSATVALIFLLRSMAEKMYVSIQPRPPSKRQLREEDLDANVLFRLIP